MARRKAPRISDALLDQLLAGADPKSAFDAPLFTSSACALLGIAVMMAVEPDKSVGCGVVSPEEFDLVRESEHVLIEDVSI